MSVFGRKLFRAVRLYSSRGPAVGSPGKQYFDNLDIPPFDAVEQVREVILREKMAGTACLTSVMSVVDA